MTHGMGGLEGRAEPRWVSLRVPRPLSRQPVQHCLAPSREYAGPELVSKNWARATEDACSVATRRVSERKG
jgi:hypothetical protein